MASLRKRVVITGFGMVSPIGSDPETVWQHLRDGVSGVRPVERMDCSALPFRSGGEVKDFSGDITDYGPLSKPTQRAIKKNMKVMCREIEMGVAASQKALSHSGLGEDRNPDRCGCLFGCDYILTRPEEYADGLRSCRQASAGQFRTSDWPTHGMQRVNPLWLLKYLPNMPNSHVSIYNDFRGPNNAITDRDASMNLAISEAASIIERGAADVMLVGATGTRLHPLRTLHVSLTDQLAKERPDPAQMARPFDQDSDGMVVGEGAGAIVLESFEHATARNARLWGEIIGCGAACVGTSISPEHLTLASELALSKALEAAGDRIPSSWHVHAQGLGDPLSDQAESAALNRILSEQKDIPVTAAKSYFGNLGAGSAAVELICSLLALEHQQLFAIQNLTKPLEGIRWSPATQACSPGSGFLHSSFTLQGQACGVMVASVDS